MFLLKFLYLMKNRVSLVPKLHDLKQVIFFKFKE